MRHPERMDAAAFGDLQRSNLQLVLRATRVTRSHTTTTEEDVMKQPVGECGHMVCLPSPPPCSPSHDGASEVLRAAA